MCELSGCYGRKLHEEQIPEAEISGAFQLHPGKAGASQQGPRGRGGFLIVALLTPISTRVRAEAFPVTSTDQKKVKSEAATTLGLIFVAQHRTNMTGTSLFSSFFSFLNQTKI